MAARRAAVALPMPLLPPVTSATFGIDSAGISIPVIYAHIVIFAASITGRHLARSPSMNTLQRVLLDDDLALVALQKGVHRIVHLAHDVGRRTGRSYDRVPRGCLKTF